MDITWSIPKQKSNYKCVIVKSVNGEAFGYALITTRRRRRHYPDYLTSAYVMLRHHVIPHSRYLGVSSTTVLSLSTNWRYVLPTILAASLGTGVAPRWLVCSGFTRYHTTSVASSDGEW